ncbi:hypothetical protein EX895_003439 [Sporisorium graminicola]|uniref:Zn(2)-C6 fungal-type domain-containing protein n=1 Tax=Sporisorium graminicola TaxID=280036 RepID=A0A4U7KWK1_9BASI|nr:hypothetical protein EX895_003439 [Sporisorium graminicola]TKY87858.1 hypothetical protein EX895_003439 [Sporisorium graminicola]
MALGVDALPVTVAPQSLVKGHKERSWTEPADEAAQCLVSMSAVHNSLGSSTIAQTGSSVATSASTGAASTSPSPRPPPARAPHSKPDRLSLACDICRKRKVRCDARQPKCTNCVRRGDVCVTSDPRRAGAPVTTRKKTTRRHTGPPVISSRDRLLDREAQQHGQRDSLSQARRDSLLGHSALESDSDDSKDDPQDQGGDGDHTFSADLDPSLNDHAFARPRMPSQSASDISVPLASAQQHRQPEQADFSSQQQQWLAQTHSQLLQTLPIDVASGSSPASVGSSTHLKRTSSTASQVRNRNRNNSSSNRRDTELPTWVSRAYKEVSAEQAPNIDQAQTTDHDDMQSQHNDADAATPDVVINTNGSPNKFKVWGGSSLQYLFKFTDVCLAGYGFDATAPLFRHGMTQSDEFDMPLFPTLPNLPSRSVVSRCVDAFFQRIWPIFPAIDRDSVQADVDSFLSLQEGGDMLPTSTQQRRTGLQDRIQASHAPCLATIYGIICLGINETAPRDSSSPSPSGHSTAMTYLTGCYSLHAHLTAIPYQSSVQALFLLALSLRACGKDGQSWYILGLALRLAMSLGLHKSVEASQNQDSQLQGSCSLRRRLWWSCCSLERLIQLECGRPSSIGSTHDYGSVEEDLSIRLPGFGPWQPDPPHSGSDSHESSPPTNDDCSEESSSQHDTGRLFAAWVSLSAIMGHISDRFYNHRFGHAIELLGETARLAHCLKRWEAALPEALKPQNSSYGASFGNMEVAIAFLAQQYYHAKMAVLRIAILFPQESFQKEVQLRSLELAEIRQLSGAASQCVSAARSLIMLTLQLADAGIHSSLIGAQQTFLSSIVLALSILRSPRSRLVGSDVELLTEATSFVEAGYKTWGYPSTYLAILSCLRERTAAVSKGHVQLAKPSRPAAIQYEAQRRRTSSTFLPHSLSTPAGHSNDHLPREQANGDNAESCHARSAQASAISSLGSSVAIDSVSDAGPSSLFPFNTESGLEAFTSMEFDDFWDILKADIFT